MHIMVASLVADLFAVISKFFGSQFVIFVWYILILLSLIQQWRFEHLIEHRAFFFLINMCLYTKEYRNVKVKIILVSCFWYFE